MTWIVPDVNNAEAAPAAAALDRVTALCGAAMRTTVAVAGAAAALASIAAPASVEWVLPAVTVSLAWSGLFAWYALRRGLASWLMAADVAITACLCLIQGRLVAAAILPDGVSWVAGLATMSIVIANFAWTARYAVPAGLAVVAAHALGAHLAGSGDGGAVSVGIQVVQVIATASLMRVLRRAAAAADEALTATRDAERDAEASRARRAEEREQNRRIHNTVLATLVTVATGALQGTSAILRERARADLELIESAGRVEDLPGEVALDRHLVAAGHGLAIAVRWECAPCVVPAAVGTAFTSAVTEALTNVARHAYGSDTLVRLWCDDGMVRINVSDDGGGFEVDAVPAHRYGIREAIVERMRSVCGDAAVASGAGGTVVSLWWTP
ncbi:ATP-binding protein [Dactylosporangium sp. NPDC051484]|uniref:sensor histidine kinase n=1 Tax=Dactylosporangium sp. NPDC051484 TaxID=3154942 RepID=UPI00344E12B9